MFHLNLHSHNHMCKLRSKSYRNHLCKFSQLPLQTETVGYEHGVAAHEVEPTSKVPFEPAQRQPHVVEGDVSASSRLPFVQSDAFSDEPIEVSSDASGNGVGSGMGTLNEVYIPDLNNLCEPHDYSFIDNLVENWENWEQYLENWVEGGAGQQMEENVGGVDVQASQNLADAAPLDDNLGGGGPQVKDENLQSR
ncbi:uncharacterized protein LOC121743488 [Salvia splendens]|uniref:uncharacterized protein LOC121743488 n=1 Tax=Salvia splendens TaxID=180675 RepID=UPI001C25594C|nr:uncharacterized protein LOC121743488 [Salvia splendens]XP_041992727.1 uncharacterized protein LOC121743488 [Salvia splendens]XP_041992728.1 uncharacterized protein LOC121743488 [Salvia splendens]XP_041992729.1 uncharacterized protein LOC121743488 [Salvia splendens]XP_041992730.1 uncharacterized protein LOC121743488 [Salvia splendens]